MTDNKFNHIVKHSGQVFTTDFLVNNILDYVEYKQGNILQKHVMDNSCGDGAFLCGIVDRYCVEFLTIHHTNIGLREELETFVHGIELDTVAYENCLFNLSTVIRRHGIDNVNWDILNADALSITQYDGLMDYVVGNPPYVRVHNLNDNYTKVKSFNFAQDGMTDLYLVFYELGLRMLNPNGKLCYITPSSWLSSIAASNMRKYIMSKQNLVGVIDLGHYQPFKKAITYTMIALFDLSKHINRIDYYTYSEEMHDKVYVDSLGYDEMLIGDSFFVATRKELDMLRAIKTEPSHKLVQVKNGFATLADKVFIGNVPFNELTIPILKGSTGKWYKGFFPYDEDGKPLPKDDIFSYSNIAEYLNANKKALLKKQTEDENPNWFMYGRTQALKDVYKLKYSINTIIRDVDTIKLVEVPIGSGMYSGLYILTEVSFGVLEEIIKSNDFISYLRTLKNYKSGGYYTYSSKDLEQYLNYYINKNIKNENDSKTTGKG